ncbi:TIGR00730 family Rossman fold protein [Mesorhizobium sp. CAU 1741]|uniref:LOG family protein n=1 Tax=Mesorhizobium sp. CAU 1741 TaxID=3140366 RepID=UPI00325AD9E9
MNMIRSICVYCGSSSGRSSVYGEAGYTLGRSMAKAGVRLVYGGGTKGIMGAVARGTIEGGGKVTGIIPRFLMNKEATESALGKLDELIVTDDMHARKHTMFDRSDAFVALPGGIGTLEEIVEIMTWAQLGQHRKPIVFANINGFWDTMLKLLDHMREEGFVHTGHLVQPIVVDNADAIVPAVLADAAASGLPSEGDPRLIDRL